MALVLLIAVLVGFGKESELICRPSEGFYSDRERGWFWKEVCYTKEEWEKLEKKKVRIPWDKLDEMSAEEIRELRERALEIAVLNPTLENVRELRKLEIWMAEKAAEFARVSSLAVMTDEELSEYVGKRPSASFARFVYFEEKQKEFERRLAKYRDRIGLVVVKDEACGYCKELRRVIELYIKPMGIEVLYVERMERPNFSAKLGVRMVPDTFLVWREGKKAYFVRIATGLVSAQTLMDRIDTILKGIEAEGKSFLKGIALVFEAR